MKMKRTVRTMLGVTLLEIMLVLAIAAMIIVMSVRYYQSATNAQQAAAAFQQAIAINTAMDALSSVSGDYRTIGTIGEATAAVKSYINATTTPNGGVIEITARDITTFAVKLGLTTNTCTTVASQLKGLVKVGTTASCDATFNLTYTYDKTK